ncbi:MAG: DUF6600 domain-containing protein [Chthoniobacteraceae bacterium]
MKTRNVLCGILMAAFPFHAGAGTLFYVPIPATGSDTQSGIAPENGYSSAVAAGTAKAAERTVNGVSFGALTGTGNTRTANGVTLSAATGSLTNGGGKADSIQADGAMAGLLSGMIFNDGAGDSSEQYAVLDPAGLTAGKTYDLRVYVCNASGENRQVSLSFAGDGKAAVGTDFFNEDDATTSPGGFIEPNQVYYINYRFTWDGVSTPGFTAVQKSGSTPFCFYALTNQEVGGDADARPSGAVVAVQPEPIAAAPRRPGTANVDSAEDIGVSSDVFYNSDSLRRHGRWVTVGTYGRCWQPSDVDADWRPYTRGHWVYSPDDGWCWVSAEDFGWATYHYGRWFREERSGWYWVPGRVWAPAWVSWRHGRSFLGWAPLPPLAIAAAGMGISSWADHRFGMGPQAYNFVNMRDFGAPSMARVLVPRQQNAALMTNTNNVTNIVNSRRGIFSGGPNFQAVNNALTRAGGQPIPAVRISRNPGNKPVTPDGKFSKLTGGVLAVTAPVVIKTKKPGSLPPVAATITDPKIDKGWTGLADPNHAAALHAKIARETPGDAAKNAPATLPGTHPSKPGTVGSKTAGPLKPSRPGKPADTTFTKPGQPVKPTGATPLKPGQPVTPATGTTPLKPGKPATTTGDKAKKPRRTPKPGTAPVPQPGEPAKPATVTPSQPGATPVKPSTPATPKPESGRSKKHTPKPETVTPSQPGAIPVKPSTPATPKSESERPKKHTPKPATPVPAPVKPAKEPAPKPAPVAKPTPRPAPPVTARPKPAPAAETPKKGKPTPTPAPGTNR